MRFDSRSYTHASRVCRVLALCSMLGVGVPYRTVLLCLDIDMFSTRRCRTRGLLAAMLMQRVARTPGRVAAAARVRLHVQARSCSGGTSKPSAKPTSPTTSQAPGVPTATTLFKMSNPELLLDPNKRASWTVVVRTSMRMCLLFKRLSRVSLCVLQGGVIAFFTVYLAWAFYTDPPSNHRPVPKPPPHLEVVKVRTPLLPRAPKVCMYRLAPRIHPSGWCVCVRKTGQCPTNTPVLQVLPDGRQLMKDGSIQRPASS